MSSIKYFDHENVNYGFLFDLGRTNKASLNIDGGDFSKLLKNTNLSVDVLRKVWELSLSTSDKSKKFRTKAEFFVSCRLVVLAQKNQALIPSNLTNNAFFEDKVPFFEGITLPKTEKDIKNQKYDDMDFYEDEDQGVVNPVQTTVQDNFSKSLIVNTNNIPNPNFIESKITSANQQVHYPKQTTSGIDLIGNFDFGLDVSSQKKPHAEMAFHLNTTTNFNQSSVANPNYSISTSYPSASMLEIGQNSNLTKENAIDKIKNDELKYLDNMFTEIKIKNTPVGELIQQHTNTNIHQPNAFQESKEVKPKNQSNKKLDDLFSFLDNLTPYEKNEEASNNTVEKKPIEINTTAEVITSYPTDIIYKSPKTSSFQKTSFSPNKTAEVKNENEANDDNDFNFVEDNNDDIQKNESNVDNSIKETKQQELVKSSSPVNVNTVKTVELDMNSLFSNLVFESNVDELGPHSIPVTGKSEQTVKEMGFITITANKDPPEIKVDSQKKKSLELNDEDFQFCEEEEVDDANDKNKKENLTSEPNRTEIPINKVQETNIDDIFNDHLLFNLSNNEKKEKFQAHSEDVAHSVSEKHPEATFAGSKSEHNIKEKTKIEDANNDNDFNFCEEEDQNDDKQKEAKVTEAKSSDADFEFVVESENETRNITEPKLESEKATKEDHTEHTINTKILTYTPADFLDEIFSDLPKKQDDTKESQSVIREQVPEKEELSIIEQRLRYSYKKDEYHVFTKSLNKILISLNLELKNIDKKLDTLISYLTKVGSNSERLKSEKVFSNFVHGSIQILYFASRAIAAYDATKDVVSLPPLEKNNGYNVSEINKRVLLTADKFKMNSERLGFVAENSLIAKIQNLSSLDEGITESTSKFCALCLYSLDLEVSTNIFLHDFHIPCVNYWINMISVNSPYIDTVAAETSAFVSVSN